jgi:pyruvate/2-oxoglutarate dehydrogenase complex dihydrolipoamide dehydrogenase (E3) component
LPSKTLIHAARVVSLMRLGPEFGLPVCDPAVDLGKVADHVQAVIDRIQLHDDAERFRGYGCEVLFGPASFIDARAVQVIGQAIRGRRFVIATGSQLFIPPIGGLEATGYLTNEDLFSLRDLPARLVVLGGGPVGLEMAQAFARLGSRVTVVERLPHLLPQEDPGMANALQAQLEAEGIAVHTSTTVERLSKDAGATQLACNGGLSLAADALLVAVGRHPVVDSLGLDAAGVLHDAKGIRVDRRQHTSQQHIYACGDVCGPYPLTHMAEYQAGIVTSNAVFRVPKKTDYRVVPWVTFTDPELARVGLTERQAREKGIDPVVLRFPFQDIDRAITGTATAGFARLVVHKKKILGASILGPHAGELIHEIVLAMKTGAGIGAIPAAIHAYPTLAQIHRRTVNTWYGGKLFSPGTRRMVRWINRLVP